MLYSHNLHVTEKLRRFLGPVVNTKTTEILPKTTKKYKNNNFVENNVVFIANTIYS